MLEGMCKLFFGPQVKCPDTTEDAGLSCNRPDTQVSNPETEHFVYIYHNIILKTIRGQDWLSKAERIRCPTPLPKGSPSPAIARMLKHALRQVPSGNYCLHEWDNRGGESKVPSSRGNKRAASEDLEAEVCKQGKKPSPGSPAPEDVPTVQRPQGGQPSTEL